MDIRIGFLDSSRELTIKSDQTQDEVAEIVRAACGAVDPGHVTELISDKGQRFLLRSSSIAYVALGSTDEQRVGFLA